MAFVLAEVDSGNFWPDASIVDASGSFAYGDARFEMFGMGAVCNVFLETDYESQYNFVWTVAVSSGLTIFLCYCCRRLRCDVVVDQSAWTGYKLQIPIRGLGSYKMITWAIWALRKQTTSSSLICPCANLLGH